MYILVQSYIYYLEATSPAVGGCRAVEPLEILICSGTLRSASPQQQLASHVKPSQIFPR